VTAITKLPKNLKLIDINVPLLHSIFLIERNTQHDIDWYIKTIELNDVTGTILIKSMLRPRISPTVA